MEIPVEAVIVRGGKKIAGQFFTTLQIYQGKSHKTLYKMYTDRYNDGYG